MFDFRKSVWRIPFSIILTENEYKIIQDIQNGSRSQISFDSNIVLNYYLNNKNLNGVKIKQQVSYDKDCNDLITLLKNSPYVPTNNINNKSIREFIIQYLVTIFMNKKLL